jgi:hypothetical protein
VDFLTGGGSGPGLEHGEFNENECWPPSRLRRDQHVVGRHCKEVLKYNASSARPCTDGAQHAIGHGQESYMKTYVAEINGEAVMAFRAEDGDPALGIVNEEGGGLRLGLHDVFRADGKPLWDRESRLRSISARCQE